MVSLQRLADDAVARLAGLPQTRFRRRGPGGCERFHRFRFRWHAQFIARNGGRPKLLDEGGTLIGTRSISRHVRAAGHEAGDRNILVDVVPVKPGAAEFDAFALRRCRTQQPREPCQRHTERAAVREIDPHRVLVKTDCGRRKAHAALFTPSWPGLSRPSTSCLRRCRTVEEGDGVASSRDGIKWSVTVIPVIPRNALRALEHV